MEGNSDLINIAITFIAGSIALGTKYLQDKIKSRKLLLAELLLVVAFTFFVIPAVIEYFALSEKIGYLIAWVISYFNDKILSVVGFKIDKEKK